MAAFGFSAEAVATKRAELMPIAVAPELTIAGPNVRAVKMLLAMGSQWNAVAMAGLSKGVMIRTGLRYEALDVVERKTGLELSSDDFGRLRLLEAECVAAWQDEREASR
jgi:hypothetical protein